MTRNKPGRLVLAFAEHPEHEQQQQDQDKDYEHVRYALSHGPRLPLAYTDLAERHSTCLRLLAKRSRGFGRIPRDESEEAERGLG